MSDPECERLRAMSAELALGIADGADRAWALEHLADCRECRVRVERLAALADELLEIAPAIEPPPGFEARVGETVGGSSPARSRGRRPRLALAGLAAGAAAVLGAGAVWLALGDDRELADSYRETLAVANGEYFDAAPIELPGGESVGYVYGYQGRTSWVLVVVYEGVAPGRYELELVAADGRKLPLRALEVDGGDEVASVGAAIPVDYSELAEVRVLDREGREVAESDVD